MVERWRESQSQNTVPSGRLASRYGRVRRTDVTLHCTGGVLMYTIPWSCSPSVYHRRLLSVKPAEVITPAICGVSPQGPPPAPVSESGHRSAPLGPLSFHTNGSEMASSQPVTRGMPLAGTVNTFRRSVWKVRRRRAVLRTRSYPAAPLHSAPVVGAWRVFYFAIIADTGCITVLIHSMNVWNIVKQSAWQKNWSM